MSAARKQRLGEIGKSIHRDLNNYCHPPAPPREGDDDLHAAMRQTTHWPGNATFLELDSLVERLAKLEGKKQLAPRWEVYEFVNRRYPRLKLVQQAKELVERAAERLKEAGESSIERLIREAREGVSAGTERFVKDLRAFAKDPRKVGRQIEWENHENVLFFRDNKFVQLKCGDLPGSTRLRCYARFLELLAADLSYERLRAKATPLLVWVAHMGNPNFVDTLGDYATKWVFEHKAKQHAHETVERKRERNRLRQRKKRKLEAFTNALD
jgi:hypothetical protein